MSSRNSCRVRSDFDNNMGKNYCNSRLFESEIPEYFKMRMKLYYKNEFADWPDILCVQDVSNMIGYDKTTIGDWLNQRRISKVKISNVRYVNKDCLIDYLCSEVFDSVYRKSDWHKEHIKIFKQWKKAGR